MTRRAAGSLGLLLGLAVGCGWGGPAYWRAKYDGEIAEATREIAAARDDAARAEAHSARAHGYSEKARYSRSFKLITAAEYERLFALAVADHDRAVSLSPAEAAPYLARGRTYYDRAALEDKADPAAARWWAAAKADFTAAIARDRRHAEPFDMRGLVHTATGDHDAAIADFTEVAAIDPHLGRLRLAEAYCTRAGVRQRAHQTDAAIDDYERAIAQGAPSDGCDCQPDTPLAWLYLEKGQYDRSWQVVHRARQANRWIQPELLEQLRKASGRDR